MIAITTILLFLLIDFSKADLCQDNFTMSEMPGGILKETIMILTTGTIHGFLGCPEGNPIQTGDVKLWLYNRKNQDHPILLNLDNPVQIDPSKPTIILAAGWLCNVTNDRMPQLKDAYLKRYDCNVIGIDWSILSMDLYTSSFCSVPKVAEIVGKFLCQINANLNVDLSKVHVLGHSMGGQLAGLIGQVIQEKCKRKLGRITGLDPAGPLYVGLPKSRRLDESDAEFVDVIHTNMAVLGYYGTCGTVDFYPNCGTFQPGCLRIDGISIGDLINLPTSVVACNHLRSSDYMVESVSSNGFVAKSCKTCPGLPVVGPCFKDILGGSQVVMGENCPSDPEDRKYYLRTNGRRPFAQG